MRLWTDVGQRLQRLGERAGRTAAKMVEDGRRRAVGQAVAVEHGEGVGEGGGVGGGRAGGDHVERVADHVGDDEAVYEDIRAPRTPGPAGRP